MNRCAPQAAADARPDLRVVVVLGEPTAPDGASGGDPAAHVGTLGHSRAKSAPRGVGVSLSSGTGR